MENENLRENIEVVETALRALSKNDMPGFMATLAEDVEWITPGPSDVLPFAGQRRGLNEVAEWARLLNKEESLEQFEIEDILAKGEKVVVIGNSRMRVRSTGRGVNAPWVQEYIVRDHKITRFREFYDTSTEVAARVPGI